MFEGFTFLLVYWQILDIFHSDTPRRCNEPRASNTCRRVDIARTDERAARASVSDADSLIHLVSANPGKAAKGIRDHHLEHLLLSDNVQPQVQHAAVADADE